MKRRRKARRDSVSESFLRSRRGMRAGYLYIYLLQDDNEKLFHLKKIGEIKILMFSFFFDIFSNFLSKLKTKNKLSH